MEREVKQKLLGLPQGPGVYLMKDGEGNVLYVGKAANIRERVRSYFPLSSALSPKTYSLMVKVEDVDFILTDTEKEAFLLECSLIKRHRPKYNIRLKDDKSYPYLRISLKEDFPGIFITRKKLDDGSYYLGPFPSAGSVRKVLNFLRKIFPLRTCRKFKSKPCLDFHLGVCPGPCGGLISQGEYRRTMEEAILFLEGKHEEVIEGLKERMKEASSRLEFETASQLRDKIKAIERVMSKQKVFLPVSEEDVVAFSAQGDKAQVEVFQIREGRIMGRERLTLEGVAGEDDVSIMGSFLKQFYASSYLPSVLLIQHPIGGEILSWLEGRRGDIVIKTPTDGVEEGLIEMAAGNALQALRGGEEKSLEELRKELFLPGAPYRIEGYDISDIGGRFAVGGMVVFEKGRSQRKGYRRFKVKTVKGADDCSMMHEVLRRRFQRKEWKLPELILIDGGKGQLSSAQKAASDAGISVSIASIAKREEEVFIPQRPDPVPLSPNSLNLLKRVRDEAHRFAHSFHCSLRKENLLSSPLDFIPGVGSRRKMYLLQRFGSLERIRMADIDELMEVRGITHSIAEEIKKALA
jgi:excinuclease ABC subunit C